jgi:hypothetical protein
MTPMTRRSFESPATRQRSASQWISIITCLAGLGFLLASSFTSTIAQTDPPARAEPASHADFQMVLANAKPGDVVRTTFDSIADVARIPLSIKSDPDAPLLVLSDKPEYFRTGNGIAMREPVPAGRVRFYAYHVPVPIDGSKRVIAVARNEGDSPVKLRETRAARPNVGGDYHRIARDGMLGLFHEPLSEPIERVIAPGSLLVIADSGEVERRDLLLHALIEFSIDGPIVLETAQIDGAVDVADTASVKQAMAGLDLLPQILPGQRASGAGRGQFKDNTFDVTPGDQAIYDTAMGVRQIVVADGQDDPWLSGVDSITGELTINKGNYGAVYRIRVPFKSSNGKRLGVLMVTARTDNQWCRAATAVVKVSDGVHAGGVIELPRDAIRFYQIPEAVVVQTFPAPSADATGMIEIDYTPPGACCLPTPILLVPID